MAHLLHVTWNQSPPGEGAPYPFSVPQIRSLRQLDVHVPVTCFVGEDGSGKSTLLEGIAAAAELPATGSRQIAQDDTLGPASQLASATRHYVAARCRRPCTGSVRAAPTNVRMLGPRKGDASNAPDRALEQEEGRDGDSRAVLILRQGAEGGSGEPLVRRRSVLRVRVRKLTLRPAGSSSSLARLALSSEGCRWQSANVS